MPLHVYDHESNSDSQFYREEKTEQDKSRKEQMDREERQRDRASGKAALNAKGKKK